MYFSEMDNGSCLLDVQENRLSLINLRWDGMVTDRFALIKGTGIMVAHPDGQEVLQDGSTFDIRWASAGSISNVKVEYSTDSGKSYTTIVSSTPNTGSYTWTVPAVNSNTALVRVSNVADATVYDESNAGFRLVSSTAPAGSGASGGAGGQGLDGTNSGGNGLSPETASCEVGSVGMQEAAIPWALGLIFAILWRRSNKMVT